MGYRILVNGVEVVCDTPQEAKQLAESISVGAGGNATKPQKSSEQVEVPRIKRTPVLVVPKVVASGSLTSEKVRKLYREVKGTNQDKLVRLLATSDQGISDKQLRDALGFASNMALAGVTAGLTKNAGNAGITIRLLDKSVGAIDGKPAYYFSLMPEFREMVKEIGWVK